VRLSTLIFGICGAIENWQKNIKNEQASQWGIQTPVGEN
jgi:hypothetical protein